MDSPPQKYSKISEQERRKLLEKLKDSITFKNLEKDIRQQTNPSILLEGNYPKEQTNKSEQNQQANSPPGVLSDSMREASETSSMFQQIGYKTVDGDSEPIHTSITTDSFSNNDSDEFQNYLDTCTLGKQFYPLSFLEDPIDLLAFFDDNISSGVTELYEWQTQTGIFLGGMDNAFTKEYPLRFHLCACNGSGKDAYVNAPFAIWFALTKVRSRCIITSASYQQLNTQTEAYIRALANKINLKLQELGICPSGKAFLIKKQHLICTLTGSEIKLFATDEEGKAEGFHPFPDNPTGEMCILINEAKSIPLEIFRALRRCTGYNYWIEVSSPGQESGEFFDHCTKAVKFPEPYDRTKRYFRRVTALECKHIGRVEIEEAARELPVELFNSIYLAQFTSISERVVCSYSAWNALMNDLPGWDKDETLTGGLDLSLGGDEVSFIPRRGNMQLGRDNTRIKNTMELVEWLENVFYKWGFEKTKVAPSGVNILGTQINTDVGGLGQPIADMLSNRFWNICYIRNNTPALRKELYINRGAEGYFHLGNLIGRKQIILIEDALTKSQLCCRQYSYTDQNKIKLESKDQIKASGRPSPDRADSLELCFCNYIPNSTIVEEKNRMNPSGVVRESRITQRGLIEKMDNIKFAGFDRMKLSDVRVGRGRISQMDLIQSQIKQHNKELAEGKIT